MSLTDYRVRQRKMSWTPWQMAGPPWLGAGRVQVVLGESHPHSQLLCTLSAESQKDTCRCLWVICSSDEEISFFFFFGSAVQWIFPCGLNNSLRSLLVFPHLKSFYSSGTLLTPNHPRQTLNTEEVGSPGEPKPSDFLVKWLEGRCWHSVKIQYFARTMFPNLINYNHWREPDEVMDPLLRNLLGGPQHLLLSFQDGRCLILSHTQTIAPWCEQDRVSSSLFPVLFLS